MKKIIACVFVFISFLTWNISAQQEDMVNQTMHFYNVEDTKEAVPFLSISFFEITPAKAEKIFKDLHEPLNKIFEESGGVRTEKDYEKIPGVIIKHIQQITEYGASAILIDFPRKNDGIMIDLRQNKGKKV